MNTAADIIEKYEVPKEFHAAVFEAYAEGSERGFIRGGIATLCPAVPIMEPA